MKPVSISLRALALSSVFLFSTGFTGLKNYTYEEILDEHPGAVCNASSDILKKGGTPGVCSVISGAGLMDAIKIAVANNPEMHMADARVQRAGAGRTEAESALWPKAGVYGEYSQGDAPSGYLFKTIDQRKLPPGTNFNDPGWYDNYEFGLNAGVNLYRGGQDMARLRMAGIEKKVSEKNRLASGNMVISSVINAYFDLFSAKEFERIAKESSSTVREQLRVMEVRFASGGALKSDILSLKVRVAEADEEVVKSHNRIQMAEASLNRAMGLPLDTKIELKEASLPATDNPATYEKALEIAMANRPELEAVRQKVVQARLSQDAAKALWLPKVDLNARLYADYQDTRFVTEDANWMVAAVVSWDVLTGNYRKAEADKASANLYEALAASRQAIMDIQLDVKNAFLKQSESEERLKVAESGVAMAKESLSLVKQQYDGGSVPITRYLEAELARNGSGIRKAAAHYDREKARADMARATGVLINLFKEGGENENNK